jgi:hypothetical protein
MSVLAIIIIPFVTNMTTQKVVDASSAAIAQENISPEIVQLPPTPMDHPALSNDTLQITVDETRKDGFSASLGMDPTTVQTKNPAQRESICVHCAVPHPTTRNYARPSEFLPIITPLIASEWEDILIQNNLYDKFKHIPTGILHGFDMGTYSFPTVSYTPRNHSSALLNPDIIKLHISNEISSKRYTGPFSKSKLEQLIGPFRTSPLGLVLKPHTTDQYRLVQDFSYPRNAGDISSINSEIDQDNFRCNWGTFNRVVEIVIHAPLGLEAATLDVDSAFRCCPILPCQQHNFVAPFGAASSGGVFGHVADAKSAICTVLGFGPNLNWVDDFVFFRLSLAASISCPRDDFRFYSLTDLYDIANRLGWPWKGSKTRPFNTSFRYLGFNWDIPSKTVSIPSEKKARYILKLSTWTQGKKFTQADHVYQHFRASRHRSTLQPLPSFGRRPILVFSVIFHGGNTSYRRTHAAQSFRRRLLHKTLVSG